MTLENPKVSAPLIRPHIPRNLVDAFFYFQLDDYEYRYTRRFGCFGGGGLIDPEIKPQ